jgi:hypothetical protein
MKAIFSCEMSVDFQWITLRYVPEDKLLQGIHILKHMGLFFSITQTT